LFDKVADEASVETLGEQEYRDVHRAISAFDALAFYTESGYVNEKDVMSMWAPAIH